MVAVLGGGSAVEAWIIGGFCFPLPSFSFSLREVLLDAGTVGVDRATADSFESI